MGEALQAFVIIAMAAMVAGFLAAASHETGNRRRSWLAFGCGGLFYLIAEIVWGIYEFGGDPPEAVSVADAFWLAAFPCYFAALYYRNRGTRAGGASGDGWIESVIVMGVFALFLWETTVEGAIDTGQSALDTVVTIAYPVGDLGVLWLLGRSIFRYDRGWDVEQGLLAGGLALLVAGDTVWAVAESAAFEDLANVLYVVSALALGGAGFRAAAGGRSPLRPRTGGRPILFELMPYIAGLAVALVPVWQIARGKPELDIAVVAVALLILVFIRLGLTLRRTRSLRAVAEDAALTDGLTGLRNHTYFHERLRAEVARAQRSGERLALLTIDVDRFKQINDTAGHPVGDRALRKLGEVLTLVSRPSDVPCRVGGDEFAVILPAVEPRGVGAYAERVAAAASEIELWPPRPGEQGPQVSLSFGGALYPVHAGDPAGLIAHADSALYGSKRDGRARLTIYDPATTKPGGPGQELAAAREEIAARELDFRALFEATGEPMLILSDEGEVLDANPAAVRFGGVPADQLAGKTIYDFELYEAADEEPMDSKRRRQQRAGFEQGEHKIRLPDGSARTVEFSATNVSPGRNLLILRDVTARRAAERKLAESEDRFRGLFDNAADAIYVTDDAGKIIDANAAAVELGGIPRDELIGAAVTRLVPTGESAGIEEMHHELLSTGAQRGVYEATWPDGRRATLEYTAVADFIPGRHLTMVREIDSRRDAADDAPERSREPLPTGPLS